MTTKRRPLLNEVGAVTSSTMIWLFFITVIMYVAYMVVPPYASFYMLRTEVEEEAELAHKFSDEALAENVLSKAYIWNVPITVNNITISRSYESIDIKLDYSEKLDFPGYTRVLNFHIAVSEPIKETGDIYR